MAKRFGTPGEGGNAGYSEEELRTPYYSSYGVHSSGSCCEDFSESSKIRENKKPSRLTKTLGFGAVVVGVLAASYGTIKGLVYLMNNN